ncbi:helix-turn-helix transcriptional regulator [Streptomyces sp. NPDC020667]|uniref:helix-turn-helix domain-containing protein n=1 Tax=Streptomyces sp. NPDC020667 TaxID=3154895 RepID=UPI0033CB603E
MLMRGIANPPVSWRYCGDQLKSWRTIAGVSREDLAKESNYGVETIKSMEQGRRKPTRRVLEVADQMCGAQGLLLAACPYLQPEPVKSRAPEFMAAEAEAIAMHGFELVLIPGLLQVEDYARALISGRCPPVDDETIQAKVELRLNRAELLDKPKTLFNFVIYEAALRVAVGGSEAMKKQFQHLLDVGQRRNVFIQVLPFSAGLHPGLNGSFTLLESPEREHIAYEEGHVVAALHGEAEKVSDLANVFAMLRMEALGTEESRRFIKKLMEEL